MFELLDDDRRFTPAPEFRSAVRRRGRARRMARRMAVGALLVVGLLVGTAGAVGFYGYKAVDDIQRLDMAGSLDPTIVDEPHYVLVVGTDDPGAWSQATREPPYGAPFRADAIDVIRIDRSLDAARPISVLALYRDLVLGPDAEGVRLSKVFERGGGEALVEAVQVGLGIPIQHYVEVDATAVVSGLGVEVELDLSHAVRDRPTGLELSVGCSVVEGDQLVALLRTRSPEYLVGDTWERDTDGDLGRVDRRLAIQAGLAAELMRSVGADDLADLVALADQLAVDATFTNGELIDLARWMYGQGTDGLFFVTAPVVPFTQDDGSAVLRPAPDWDETLEAWRSDAPFVAVAPLDPPTTSPDNQLTLTAC